MGSCTNRDEAIQMVVKTRRVGISKQSFDDVLGGVHAHTFGLDPEAEPYLLSVLDREYIAYALALYYKCEHCRTYHQKEINALRLKEQMLAWSWQKEIARTVLFLRVQIELVSALEQEEWIEVWRNFGKRINYHVPHLACYIAAAIAISRDDEALLMLVGKRYQEIFPDIDERRGRMSDVLETVSFMKAAVTKNRVEKKLKRDFLL